MPKWVTAQVSDTADLKLKQIEIAVKEATGDGTVRRPQVVELAIQAADPARCAELHQQMVNAAEEPASV